MYWEVVLQEVLHKNHKKCIFRFTNLDEIMQEERKSTLDMKEPRKKPKRYYVSESEQQNHFFTQREYDCMREIVKGHTFKHTALVLGLSPRTVEYYVNNLKERFTCRNKIALVKKVRGMKLFETD